MVYRIGDRILDLNPTKGSITVEDAQLIVAHRVIFRLCLNNATYMYLTSIKKMLHLYGDIMTIYSTILKKVPNYDDVTEMVLTTHKLIETVEQDFNDIFGSSVVPPITNDHWETWSYELKVKPLALLCINSAIETMENASKTVDCVDVFFESFNNLKRLLIPKLALQAAYVRSSLDRALNILHTITEVDDLVDEMNELGTSELARISKIETLTTMLENETSGMKLMFNSGDRSLDMYSVIILGKGILRQDLSAEECQILRRREICFQAENSIACIPLTDNPPENNSWHNSAFGGVAGVAVLVFMVAFVVVYRLYRIFFF
ncbi:uncharacterized protein KQ657_003823 [Scheffersomyces spartinae]|uniref:Uncharacterized protein n=1 Tax=Scheffersomyces spartinae TaxID=45513 RepID=A0A9P7VCE1_9ASCO|nr:uncharacterized protein KQ657_003823 [Scheffersomyces spartinae]KAG7195297.1 hypothetical protein KQ657_003823 [Scheffersomyces spartinae]